MFNALAINALAGTLLIVGIWSRLASTVATLQEAPSWSTPLRRVILVALPRFALAYLLYSGLLDMSAARIVFGLLVFTIALHVPVLVDAFLALIDAPLDTLQRIIWLTLPAIGACVGTFGVNSMEWREPNGLAVQYIDGRLAPIGGLMSLSVLVVYGLLYRQVLRARSERSQRTQKILLYSIDAEHRDHSPRHRRCAQRAQQPVSRHPRGDRLCAGAHPSGRRASKFRSTRCDGRPRGGGSSRGTHKLPVAYEPSGEDAAHRDRGLQFLLSRPRRAHLRSS